MKHATPTSRRWPCVFPQPASTIVDPQVDALWTNVYGKTPFGDLRNQFRRQHCRTLNPYGSETCPYPPASCARAFLSSVERTIQVRPRVPVGYFMKVTKTLAAIRADEKPLARSSTNVLTDRSQSLRVRTDVSEKETEEREGRLGEAISTDSPTGQGLRSPTAGPISIGQVLGSLDIRPRQRADDEGKEGTE